MKHWNQAKHAQKERYILLRSIEISSAFLSIQLSILEYWDALSLKTIRLEQRGSGETRPLKVPKSTSGCPWHLRLAKKGKPQREDEWNTVKHGETCHDKGWFYDVHRCFTLLPWHVMVHMLKAFMLQAVRQPWPICFSQDRTIQPTLNQLFDEAKNQAHAIGSRKCTNGRN